MYFNRVLDKQDFLRSGILTIKQFEFMESLELEEGLHLGYLMHREVKQLRGKFQFQLVSLQMSIFLVSRYVLKGFNVFIIDDSYSTQAPDPEYLQEISTFQNLQKETDKNALGTVVGVVVFSGACVLASPLTFPLAISVLTVGSANMIRNIYKMHRNMENRDIIKSCGF